MHVDNFSATIRETLYRIFLLVYIRGHMIPPEI